MSISVEVFYFFLELQMLWLSDFSHWWVAESFRSLQLTPKECNKPAATGNLSQTLYQNL